MLRLRELPQKTSRGRRSGRRIRESGCLSLRWDDFGSDVRETPHVRPPASPRRGAGEQGRRPWGGRGRWGGAGGAPPQLRGAPLGPACRALPGSARLCQALPTLGGSAGARSRRSEPAPEPPRERERAFQWKFQGPGAPGPTARRGGGAEDPPNPPRARRGLPNRGPSKGSPPGPDLIIHLLPPPASAQTVLGQCRMSDSVGQCRRMSDGVGGRRMATKGSPTSAVKRGAWQV